MLHWGEELLNFFAASWINDLPTGPVDQEELDSVLLNWGTTVDPLAAGSVPEPASLVLIMSLVLCLLARRLSQ